MIDPSLVAKVSAQRFATTLAAIAPQNTSGQCHMYGLGIYLADMAHKSHRYCSEPKMGAGGRQVY